MGLSAKLGSLRHRDVKLGSLARCKISLKQAILFPDKLRVCQSIQSFRSYLFIVSFLREIKIHLEGLIFIESCPYLIDLVVANPEDLKLYQRLQIFQLRNGYILMHAN